METKWACCSKVYGENTSLERAMEGIGRAGIKYIELAAIPGYREHVRPEGMSDKHIELLLKRISQADIEALSISGHSELAEEQGVKIFMERMTFASKAGIKIVNTGPGKTPDGRSKEAFFENMKRISELAEKLDLTVGLEIHGELTANAGACKKTLERINSPQVGINYDTANVIYFSGIKPQDDIRDIASHIVHLHLKDIRGGKGSLDFPVLGEGEVDFAKVFSILDEVHYDGPYCIELELVDVVKGFTDEDGDEALAESFKFLKGIRKGLLEERMV